jgi:FkbM family methyltransferase
LAKPAKLDPPFGAFAPTPVQKAVINFARATFFHRGDWRPMMGRLLAGFRSGPVDVERDIGKYRLHYLDNLIEIGVLLHPKYNGRDIAFCREVVDDGGWFVDVGANIGLYSLAVATQAPKAKVLAIEPGPTALSRLYDNMAASDLTARIQVAECAISDSERTGGLVFKDGDLAIARFEEDAEGGMVTRTLLSLLTELKITKIASLKIDIEGREGEALAPFFRDAPKSLWPKRVVIEHLHDDIWGADLFGQMFAGGYKEVGRTKQNSLLELG